MSSLPSAHSFVPFPPTPPGPQSPSRPSSSTTTPITLTDTNTTLTTIHDLITSSTLPAPVTHGYPYTYTYNQAIPPPRPPRSPRRTPLKRLDIDAISAKSEQSQHRQCQRQHQHQRQRNTSSLSLYSLEYVRTALRTFRSTLPAYRFPDKDKKPIRSPSRKYQKARQLEQDLEGWEFVYMPGAVQRPTETMPGRKGKNVVRGVNGTREQYGRAREVRREGVGGHWRSYSLPPVDHEREGGRPGRQRVLSEGYEPPSPGSISLPLSQDLLPPDHTSQPLSPPLPTFHLVHPSVSTHIDDPSQYPPIHPDPHLHHPHGSVADRSGATQFANVVEMMKAGQATRQVLSAQGSIEDSDAVFMTRRSDRGGSQGRAQTARRNIVGPGGVISRIASRSSLSKLKIAFLDPKSPSDQLHATTAKRSPRRQPSPAPPSARGSVLIAHRPAPLPPTIRLPSPNRFAPSTSRIASPTPSVTPARSRSTTPLPMHTPNRVTLGMNGNGNAISPGRSSVWEKEDGLVEIPRFKKREMNLGIVAGGKGQRVGWWCLWTGWILWGLISIFFDVNVLYMLIQCAQNPSTTPDSASSRTWVFAIAAYAICWAISIFGIWLGWELWFEYWRRWRLPRPAIEPIHTSLAASLHLSLTSFRHFTFFLYVRASPLSTPYWKDIFPETAHLLIQTLPGLAPILPRASLAVVLLVAFWNESEGTLNRDPAFWKPSGALTTYSSGVLLAFVSLTALRLLIAIISAMVLWIFSRPRPSFMRTRFNSFSSSPTTTRPSTPTRPRDPADTQSPSRGWLAESDLKWEWRERGRNRLQDAFELCMIRRPSRASTPADWLRSPSKSREVLSMIHMGRGEKTDEVLSPTSADPFMRVQLPGSTIRFGPAPHTRQVPGLKSAEGSMEMEQARPESGIQPSPLTPIKPNRSNLDNSAPPARPSTNSLDPRTAFGTLPHARQSQSSQDLFYTPMSRTPVTERTASHADIGLSPSRSTLQPGENSGSGGTTTPTPPSAYRRPPAPGPGPSTAATSNTTLHALDGESRHVREISGDSTHSNKENILVNQGKVDEFGVLPVSRSNCVADQDVPTQGQTRTSGETTSGESITDDSAALLSTDHGHSRSSSTSAHVTSAVHGSHSSHTRSIRRTSQSLRDRSASFITRIRTGSISTAQEEASPDSRRGSYANMSTGRETSRDRQGKVLVRGRSTSVGLLRETASGAIRRVRSGTVSGRM